MRPGEVFEEDMDAAPIPGMKKPHSLTWQGMAKPWPGVESMRGNKQEDGRAATWNTDKEAKRDEDSALADSRIKKEINTGIIRQYVAL